MSDVREFITHEQAIGMLGDEPYIHTFIPSGFAMIGADRKREDVIEEIKKGKPELTGPFATAAGHGIVLCEGRTTPLFIATKSILVQGGPHAGTDKSEERGHRDR